MASTDTPPDEVEDSSSSCGQSSKASKDNKKCCIAGNSLSPDALTDSYDDKFLCDNPADCDQCNDNSCDQGDCNCVDCACNHGNCNHGDSTQDNCAFTNGYGKGSAKRTISNSSDDNCFHLELEDKCEDIKKEETPQQTNDQTPQSTITQGSLSSQDPQVQSEPQAAIENGAKKKVEKRPRFSHQSSWKDAVKKAWSMTDPWAKFHIHDNCAMEIAVRHRYNAIKKSWVKDEIRIKMESVPFDQGAMRVCYRLKKLSNFSKHNNWKHASNYVAKSYIEEVSRDQYFEDVRLQMDAKLWGEEYNRRDPPKKVDIFQTYIIELKERTGSPLYHLEHFIEGTYKKYNSNSGFVLRDETLRCTPQAFSHFTFERSGHQLIVVDIQGVGDLYTDPQIHTADMKDYGEANFGPQGMALFFSSHKCNRICKTLGLTEFDISAVEDKRIDSAIQVIQDSSTVVKSSLEDQLSPRKMSAIFDLSEYCLGQSPPPSPGATEVSPRSSVSSCNGNPSMSDSETSETESDTDVFLSNISSEDDDDVKQNYLSVHVHKASSVFAESEQLAQAREQQKEKLLRQKSVSVLGKVHLEMAKYGEIGRFTSDREPDMESAMFHMEKAAQCGITTALVTLAEIYLQLPHDLMESATVQVKYHTQC